MTQPAVICGTPPVFVELAAAVAEPDADIDIVEAVLPVLWFALPRLVKDAVTPVLFWQWLL